MKKLFEKFPRFMTGMGVAYLSTMLALNFIFVSAGVRVMTLTLLGFVLAALMVPYFLSAPERKTRFSGLAASAGLLVLSLGMSFLFLVAGDGATAGMIIESHVLLACYAVLAGGLAIFFGSFMGRTAGAVASAIILLGLMGSLFFANGFVSTTSGGTRGYVINAALTLNPMAAAGQGVFEADVTRMQTPINLYDLSNISDYAYAAPSWGWAAVVYLVLGVLSGAAGTVVELFKSRFSSGGKKDVETASA